MLYYLYPPPPPVIFIPVKLTDIYKEREAPELSSKLDQGDIVPIKQIWKYIYPDLVSSQVGLTHEVFFFVDGTLLWLIL